MKFIFLTLFPELIQEACQVSIIGRAIKAGLFTVECINPRDYTTDNHRSVDDTPCGGGLGMVLKPQPFLQALEDAKKIAPEGLTIALTPGGQLLTQPRVVKLAHEDRDIIFLCGHYEGFDRRILDQVDMELSIGDYVLTGGELPALVMLDAVARYIPGVLGKEGSTEEESFSDGLLEYPQYTRPIDYQGQKVPDILLSGDHAAIKKWRRKEALKATLTVRPDVLNKAKLTLEDTQLLWEIFTQNKVKKHE
jgi:tRNA (guanine37-N1)-methyltransferase